MKLLDQIHFDILYILFESEEAFVDSFSSYHSHLKKKLSGCVSTNS